PRVDGAVVGRSASLRSRTLAKGAGRLAAKSKYRAVKTEFDGIVFDSKKEARRWGELLLLHKAKVIRGLDRQVPFAVTLTGHKICAYKADFMYFENGKRVIEDAKGFRTAVYRLKKKLVEAMYNVTIREV